MILAKIIITGSSFQSNLFFAILKSREQHRIVGKEILFTENATLSSSFFEESCIKALSLQKEGETALLLWLRLFFTAVREDSDGKLMLYGTVAHDEKSISAVYCLPIAVARTALELLVKFDLLVQGTDHYADSNFAQLLSANKRERHRKAQQKYVESKAAVEAGAKA